MGGHLWRLTDIEGRGPSGEETQRRHYIHGDSQR